MENQNINLIENENKSIKSKLLTWVATILLGALVGVGAFLSTFSPRYQKSSAYSIDLSTESITFSVDELNNNRFQYLANQVNSLSNGSVFANSYITYNSFTFNFDEFEKNDYLSFYSSSNETYIYLGLDFTGTVSDYGYGQFIYESLEYSFTDSMILYGEWFVNNIQEPKSVTLTASELNNNHYVYLAEQLSLLDEYDIILLQDSYIVYNGEQFDFNELASDFVGFDNGSYGIWFNFDNEHTGEFSLEDTYNSFSDSITIYSDWIVDNLYAPNSPSTWLDDIIALLTGGIVGLSGGIGSGVSTFVGDIFISNNALSVMGGMIVVFAGISLAIGLCRWVMIFLTSLGAKK